MYQFVKAINNARKDTEPWNHDYIENVPLNVVMVPGLSSFTCIVDSLHELVHVGPSVHGIPKTLTVGGVVAASEALLITIVEEGDATGRQRKAGSVLEAVLASRVDRKEPRVVMVVHEGTENIDVGDSRVALLCVAVAQVVHAIRAAKYIAHAVEHWVVEQRVDVVLIVSDIVRIAIEGLAHLEDASRLSIILPEVLGHVRDGIDSDAIKVKPRNCILDPILQVGAHEVIALVKVG